MQRFRGKKTTLGATALSPGQRARGALRPGAGAGGAQGPGGRGPVVPTTLWVPPWGRDAFPSHQALALPTRSEQGDVCHSSTLVTSVLKTPAGLQLTVAGAGCETQDPGQQQRLGGKVTACRAGGGDAASGQSPRGGARSPSREAELRKVARGDSGAGLVVGPRRDNWQEGPGAEELLLFPARGRSPQSSPPKSSLKTHWGHCRAFP